MHILNFRQGISQVGCACSPHRCIVFVVAAITVLYITNRNITTRPAREDVQLAEVHNEMESLMSLYKARQEEVVALQIQLQEALEKKHLPDDTRATLSPEAISFMKKNNISDTRLVAGLHTNALSQVPFLYDLLPHHMNNQRSLYPGFHLRGSRNYSKYVLGIPTVRRDKENYLLITLESLLAGLKVNYENSTLIVICVGETDLEYVIYIAQQVVNKFPKQVESGLIEIISPSSEFYPDLSKDRPNLGDSAQRYRWRTKQNLDALFLMAYAQSKGTYYLMLEDDIICKSYYMDSIRKYTAEVSFTNPDWVYIEYSTIGGIGKLFKSSKLMHFLVYLEILYRSMPIDWLIDKYLDDIECGLSYTPDKNFNESDAQMFYPHFNPPVENATTSIKVHGESSLLDAYLGLNYFWGIKPVKGDTVEFVFKEPTFIKSFLFRSGNMDHVSDRFRGTVVEAVPSKVDQNAILVGSFDEFGLAEGTIKKEDGPLHSIRLKVNENQQNSVILSEILLTLYDNAYKPTTTLPEVTTEKK